MQGIFINGRRPKSKKEIKEVISHSPAAVRLEATSLFGDEYDGPVSDAIPGSKFTFVGPDPYNKRNFYGTITIKPDGTITVK
jgi:hypothetical protein